MFRFLEIDRDERHPPSIPPSNYAMEPFDYAHAVDALADDGGYLSQEMSEPDESSPSFEPEPLTEFEIDCLAEPEREAPWLQAFRDEDQPPPTFEPPPLTDF